MNYGYNEYFTNTASGDYIHLEDSINYPYKKLEVDGVCEQNNYTGKNLLSKTSGTNNMDNYYYIDKPASITIDESMVGKQLSLSFDINITSITTEITPYSCIGYGVSNMQTVFKNYQYDDFSLGKHSIKVEGALITNEMIGKNIFLRYLAFSKKGNVNAEYSNAQLEFSPTATEYEPYTGGQPSPSPDYPQEIKTIENSVSVKSMGKNLFNEKNIVNLALSDKIIYHSAYKGYYISCKEGDVFSLSRNDTTNNRLRVVFTTEEPANGVEYFGGTGQTPAYDNSLKIENIVAPKNANYIFIYLSNEGDELPSEMQLERNPVATDYEPYRESSITANLPEGEFIGKIDDTYKDTLKVKYNEEDGQYHLVLNKMICKVVLDGSENWNYQNKTFTIFLDNIKIANRYEDRGTYLIISDYFLKGETNYRDAVQDLHIAKTIDSKGNQIGIKYAEITSLDDFKAWLSTHNTEVYYVLAEPYVVDLGIVDMPTTYDSITNLYTDSDLIPTINVEYYTEILENAKDNIIGQDIYLQDEVDTLNDLPTEANKGDIRKVKDTESWYIYDGTIWSAFDKASEIDLTNYLSKDNTIPYAPSTDYNPATKRYVDTKVDALFIPTKTSQLTNDSGFVLKSVNDLTNYYNKSNTYNKAEVNALVAGGGGGSNISITVNGDTLVITTK